MKWSTPDQMRADLEWLYDHGFYVVNLNDILNDSMNVPAGKKPVAFTFDDSPAGQFRLLKLNTGQYAIDPNCAIGILENFFGAHPDFGHGGHFAVLPNTLFDWTLTETEQDQVGLGEMKLRWLLDNGYEIGNHTLEHVNLGEITDDQIMYQLAGANDAIQKIVPDADVDVVTLPFGVYPDGGDDSLLRGFDYNGKHYAWKAALLVGANPTVSPISTEYDPYATARIQAFDDELNKWFGIFEDNPGLLYVSDGNPNTVTVPNDLHSWIVGTLDDTKIGNRELIRY
jgi:peptidoglycan/xylan/chitin deacetylase (PgdA/CDA1 family)